MYLVFSPWLLGLPWGSHPSLSLLLCSMYDFLQTIEVLVFEECVGKTKAECLVIVSAVLDEHPDLMPVGALSADSFVENLNVEELAMRSQSSDDYYKVGLRTDYEETHIVGVLGDGMTFYPYPWCTAGTSQHPPINFIMSYTRLDFFPHTLLVPFGSSPLFQLVALQSVLGIATSAHPSRSRPVVTSSRPPSPPRT